TQIQGGNRIRFLSQFYLSQVKIELEFSEIRLLSISGIAPQLVYTDSKEYTYNWLTNLWTTGITNYETTLINPQTYTLPILVPNTSGREIEYQGYLNHIQTHNDLVLTASYWGSIESTEVPSLHSSRSSTLESEYLRSWELDFQRASPALDPCLCGIDVCYCNTPNPDTPPTPGHILLWKPREHSQPIDGIHFNRYTG